MSLGNCIPGMVKRGEIDATRGARMKELFDELEGFYRRSMGPEAAAAEASEATLRQLAAEQRHKKRQTLLQINRQREAVKDLDHYRTGANFSAIRAMLDRDTNAPYSNVTLRTQQIVYQAHAQLREFLDRHSRNLLGKPRDRDGLRNVVREMHGQDSGDAVAKTTAQAITELFDTLRQRFNAAGGNIGRLEHWFPHRWSPQLVRKVSRDTFVDTLMPELDRARIFDNRTGAPMADDALREMLGGIYETVRTNGLTGDPSAALRGAGKLANQRAEHRVLHFKDADAWLRINDQFGGERNPFNAIMGHIDGMAQDIAMMERLGPNPDATMRYLLDHVSKKAAQSDDPKALDKLGGGRAFTEQMYRYLKGEGRQLLQADTLLHGPPTWFVRGFEGGLNLTTAMKLGAAPLSALSDVGTQLMARRFNGLPAVSVLRSYLSQLSLLSGKDREIAIELELGMRDAAHSLSTLHRWGVDADRAGWTAVVADDVLRISGLNKLTEAGQRAYGMDTLAELARQRSVAWGKLPAKLREGLQRYGVDQADWTAIRQSAPLERGGRSFVSPSNIRESGTLGSDAAAAKLMDYVYGETAAAVQEASLTTRAVLAPGDRGTWKNMAARMVSQFRAFGIGLVIEHGRRAMALGPKRGPLYAVEFFIGMTVLGAAVMQIREIAKGKDPRPMGSGEFWSDAVLQAGALGIVGDVLGSFSLDRVDGWAELMVGPMGSQVKDIMVATKMGLPGKKKQDGTQRPANPVGAALYLARKDTPGLSTWWHTRAVWEQLVLDRLAAEYDPDYDKKLKRQTDRDTKNGQGRWLSQGGVQRAPDFSNALRAPPAAQ